jgi:hypothetical protein
MNIFIYHLLENRIGTALWRASIPEPYRKYPFLNQGATSIVLDKGEGRVLMLTRDDVKKDWLTNTWGLDIGTVVDTFEVTHKQSRDIGNMSVYVIDLPLLFPMSAANKQIVKKAVVQYNNIALYKKKRDILNAYLEAHPDTIFTQLIEFLTNYDDSQYQADFLMRNFMQDATGKIVLIDPIVSKPLLDALIAIKSRKNQY